MPHAALLAQAWALTMSCFSERGRARRFDLTNSLVESCVAQHAKLFRNWSQGDFDELYSRWHGQPVDRRRSPAAAQATNIKRDLWRQVGVSGKAVKAICSQFVGVLTAGSYIRRHVMAAG